MYSVAKNVKIVIALLKAHNINQLVLSPGGTNAPFIRGVQDDSFFQCYSVVDERSALYFAIGIYLSTGKPVAVCCTSAQATRNYLPGLTEAFYKHVPILAITFSKHPQYTYQDYMQAPDQTSLPRDAVRATYALPYVSNEHDRMHCERLVNEAILELTHIIPAPIQINVPMLDTELSKDDSLELPNVKVIRRYFRKDIPQMNLSDKKILIVVGENRGIDDKAIVNFASSTNTSIYVNHLSNMENDFTIHGNQLLTCVRQDEFDALLCPDILITIGGQTGDYPLYHRLSGSNKKYEHWRISEKGDVVDTYDHLTKIFECSYDDFFSSFHLSDVDNNYFETWKEASLEYTTEIDLPFSAAYVAQQMCGIIPEGSYVNFSILNSLRIWNLFTFKNKVKCFSNVGAFGIDGCMSTFIGQSVMIDQLCFMFIGDLSFFYDMNSLGIRHIKNNVRIILINNNGGVEFKLYEKMAEKREKIDQYIAASNHFKNAEGWAVSNGFDYYRISSKESFHKVLNKMIGSSESPIIMEIMVTDGDEGTAFSRLRQVKDNRTFTEKIFCRVKGGIKRILK